MNPQLKQAANAYYRKGWMPIPLGPDSNGLPKRPLDVNWSHLERKAEVIRNLRWDSAVGIGIVLGAVSGHLAVMDIDDQALAESTLALFQRKATGTRLVQTARKRIHVYVQEQEPSQSRRLEVQWRHRTIGVELRTTGNQVAAPPSPGYSVLIDATPMQVPSILEAWASLARHLGVHWIPPAVQRSAGYPRPWPTMAEPGQRNNTAYIEAHKLREANIPLDQALQIMEAHITRHYDGNGLSWQEVERTVRSAYAKGPPQEYGYRRRKFVGPISAV